MKHISLFSGIGGFDLAAEWMGWENVAHCEWNPFGQRVLKYYWPNSISYHDITKTDFTIHRGTIDIVTGGFPCQPYSVAGKRKGKEDERHLWPEMLRAIREIQPRWVVGENVRGIINWDGGLVFKEVQADLEAEGYKILPFLLPAASVNAPHERYRTWFVAVNLSRPLSNTTKRERQSVLGEDGYRRKKGICSGNRIAFNTNDKGGSSGPGEVCKADGEIPERHQDAEPCNSSDRDAANAGCKRLQGRSGCEREIENTAIRCDFHKPDCRPGPEQSTTDTSSIRQPGEEHRQAQPGRFAKEGVRDDWQNFPTQSPIRLGNDGLSRKLERYISKDIEYEISQTSQENRIENLSEVWEIIQQEEIWEKVRGFYSLESKEVLFQTMQLYSTGWTKQRELSSFSEEVSRSIMQRLSKYREFRRTPQGRKLEKQRAVEFGNSLSFLPHEVALAAKTFEKRMMSFDTYWRNESIKAGGNAIVPQVVYQIFKATEAYESQ